MTATDEPLLVVRGVAKAFKGVQALAGVELEVRRGEILGLVGPNGSGKSTLINVVSGHYLADGGSIRFEGEELVGTPRAPHRARRHRADLPDPAPVPAPDRAAERRAAADVRPGGRWIGARAEAEAWRWLAFTGLEAKAHRFPADLNLHERKFLELARALASRPKLLFLDEVLSGLTPAEMDGALRLIRAIRDQGATIVFVEHVMRAVMELTDRVVVLTYGKSDRRGRAARGDARPAGGRRLPGQPRMFEVSDVTVNYGAAPAVSGRAPADRAPASWWWWSARTAPARSTLINAMAGLHAVASGRLLVDGQRHHARGAASLLRARHRDRARGPAPVREPQRAREPGARQLPRRGAQGARRFARARLRAVPGARGAHGGARRRALRRPAADGRDRPGADGAPEVPAAGRAFARPLAGDRAETCSA